MTRMLAAIAAVFFIFTAPSIAGPQEDALALRYLEATGGSDALISEMRANKGEFIGHLTGPDGNMSPVQAELMWEGFITQIEADLPAMMRDLAGIYSNHFTLEELEALVIFAESGVAQKLAALEGQIAKEAETIATIYAQRAMQRALFALVG